VHLACIWKQSQFLKPNVLVSKKSTDDGQGPREEECINNYGLFTDDCHISTETNSQLAACTSIQVNQILHQFIQSNNYLV